MSRRHRIPAPAYAIALLALPCLVGCGGPGGGGSSFSPKNPFPTSDKLAQLAAGPAKPVAPRNVASTPEWKVDPTGLDTPPPVETRFGAAANGSVTFTRELRCVAREVARFHIEHGARRLREDQRAAFGMPSRCPGATPCFRDQPALTSST